MEDALESTDDSLDKFMLAMVNLLLRTPICISSEIPLDFARLDIAEVVVKRFVFAIFLLGTIIHDSSMRERSV